MRHDDMIRSVMCMLTADGSINKQEMQFLQRLCQQFAISKDVVQAAFEEVKQGKRQIALPNTDAEKEQLFDILGQAAMADGEIGPKEQIMLDAAAAKMGIAAMVCPKCGAEQRKAFRCKQCGIFIKNYAKQPHKTERQARTPETDPLPTRIPISLYTPSGTLTIYALPIAVILGLVIAAGVGWLYQLIVGWNPLIYLNLFVTLIYGALIGRAVGLGLQFGKCRNIIVGMVLAFIVAIISELLTFRYAYADMAAVRAQVETGWFISGFGVPVGLPLNGPAVYLVWAVECILLCVAAVAAATIAPGEPFCEQCQQWTKKRHLGKIPDVDERYLLIALQEGNLQPFLQPPPQASWKTVSYDLYSCPRCSKGRYLSVTVEWEEEGKKEEEMVLEYAIVTHEHLAELRKTLRQAHTRGS